MSRGFRSQLMPLRVRWLTVKLRVQLALTKILKIMLTSFEPKKTNRAFPKEEKIQKLIPLEAQKLRIDRLVLALAKDS